VSTERNGVRHVGVVFQAAHRAGGVERVAWDLLNHLGRRPGTVSFYGQHIEPHPGGTVRLAKLEPARVPAALRPVAFRRAAARAIAADPPDLLVSFGATCPPGDVLWVQSVHRAWLAQSRTITWRGRSLSARTRYVLARHQVLLELERQYFTRSNPRHVLCTSQREVDALSHCYSVPRELMTVVPNGYDPGQFSPERRSALRPAVRQAMGVDDGDLVLLFVANELHRKGFGQTLEAVARLHDRRVHVALVGRRPPTDYAEVIQRLGLGEQVQYHGPTDDVGRWHAGADLLVLPSQYEPFGIVIVEALASGLPVVTTRLAGASVAVEHGVTGWLQDDPYDVDELTALLRAALDADLVEAGRRAALGAQPYQWSQIFRRVERLVGL
jgi:UDP-glucose:(heptosyl)LPS alpha-1,3-glucosyltransferase